MRRLRLLALCAFFGVATASAQTPNLTGQLENLGDPIGPLYANPAEKGSVYDLQAFDGRVYIGHGSSNASATTRVLYYDPAARRFDADRNPDGSYVELPEEGTDPVRVLDGELHIGSMDPNRGGTHFMRKRNGVWSVTDIGEDTHNWDLRKFRGVYFFHHGKGSYPNTHLSTDDGKTWTRVQQTDVTTQAAGYVKYFEFGGEIYMSSLGGPWLSKYTGDVNRPFQPIVWNRSEVIAGSTANYVMEDATVIGDRLVFHSSELYSASRLAPGGVERVAVPGFEQYAPYNILRDGNTLYVLLLRQGENVVASTQDGVNWQALFRFRAATPATEMELLGGDFYFGGVRSFSRMSAAAYGGRVEVPNVAPTAAFTVSTSDGPAPLPVAFDGTGSSDADGRVVEYAWDFGDGQTATGPAVSHTYAQEGNYDVRLTVRDDDGATATSAPQKIKVKKADVPNVAPVAVVRASAAGGQAPVAITFDGSGSADADGRVVEYAWDFGDGQTATGPGVSHTYGTPGAYAVRLTVRDDDGAAATSAAFAVTITAPPPPPASQVGPWRGLDIGSAVNGSEAVSGAQLTVRGGGHDIWDTRDGFRFVYQPLAGDGVFVARIASQQHTNDWAKAGLMVRHTLTESSSHALVAVTPKNGLTLDTRSQTGSTTANTPGPRKGAPSWLRLERRGDRVTTSFSEDGQTWTPIGTATFGPGAAYVGLAVLSHDTSKLSEVVADNISLVTSSTTDIGGDDAASAWQGQDVGTATGGTQAVSGDQVTVRGGGHDIWDTRDGFRFVYQPLAGDGVFVARIASQQHTNDWAKAGLMVRQNLSDGSPYVMVGATPANGLLSQWRFPGAPRSIYMGGAKAGAPTWLRIERRGQLVRTSYSADGRSWVMLALSVLPQGDAYVGFAVTSRDAGRLSEATFDNVSLSTLQPSAFESPLPPVLGGGDLGLGTAAPNPVRTAATIRYTLPEAGAVRLELFDALGRRVATLVDETLPAGEHAAYVDAAGLAPGTYVYRLGAGDRQLTKTLQVVR